MSGTNAPGLPLGPIIQIAYVVTDIEKSVDYWSRKFGAGPFFLFDQVVFPGWTYRGVEAELPIDLAVGQLGEVNIEFIVQKSDQPSVYRDMVPAGTTALHHYAVLVEDLECAAREIHPAPLITSAHTGAGTPFGYYDTRETLGLMIEIIQSGADIRGMFKSFADAAKGEK